MSDTLLTLRDVHINFPARKNWLGKTTEHVHAINGIDLQIRRGETLGIVGESGCGKSTLAQLLMGMLQPSHGQYIRSGSQRIMQMVFQDPLSSLNPRLPVWRVITEPLWIAKRSSEQQRRALAEELAVQVGIRPEYLDRLPHAFSGGQRQRIAIARALSSQPDVIVLDEPTSALDISVQAQILNLLVTLQENHGLTYVLISHNVSVIRHMSDRVAVMYLGQIVELGDAQQVLTAPAHPYTRWHNMDDILQNVPNHNIKVIVVTDGERILGLGDQGIGGMGIPIGKLSLYTACGGISPAYTLPVVLDVGTNNQQLLNDPLYMGWRNPRITDDEYYEFVDEFIQAVKQRWPDVLLQFEDFAQKNAMPLLNRYRNEICSFNDDIQGTAAVTVGTLIAASRAAGGQLSEKKIVFLGAGSAGCGIAEMIIAQTQREGLSEEAARQKVFMVDRFGLLTDKMPNLLPFQTKLVQKRENLSDWDTDSDVLSLLDVVRNVKPDILIGVSGQTGLFTEEIIREMHKHCPRPIVMPLSNPTSRVEATPQDIIAWTEGNALVATGSPFNPVVWKDKIYPIAQCNNAFIFPGIGLGVIASGASRITDEMLMSASETLAQYSPLVLNGEGLVLPELKDIQKVSRAIAFAVGKMAQQQGVAVKTSAEALQQAIDDNFWQAEYRDYRRTSI
ncbi:oxaloacetate-decarboxylating malate dehydrogenase [Escherichia coli]|nr:oxaloacetate-decarboxylating malate dehydrogenase [Escherichia coli]